MRAVVISQPGPPEVLQLQEVPDPVAGPGEVVVDVAASAVNRADLLQRQGFYDPPPGASPYPGLECSGTIRALGPGVVGWRVGDPVCALLAGGGYAQQVAVPAGQLLPVPAGVPLVEAAALPEVTCTVWSMVFGAHAGRLQPGERLLVHGGTSGIGTMAIQLAVAFGSPVVATAGTAEKVQLCLDFGATAAINYRQQSFADVLTGSGGDAGPAPGSSLGPAVGPADVILDNMGAAYLRDNVRALAVGGRLIVLGMQSGRRGELDLGLLMGKQATVHTASLRARPAQQKAQIVAQVRERIWPLIEAGTVRPVVDRVLPLAQAAEAHRAVDASAHVGKVLLQV